MTESARAGGKALIITDQPTWWSWQNQLELVARRSLLLTYLVIMTQTARAGSKALIIIDLPGDHDRVS